MATNAVTIPGWDAEFNGLVLDTEAKGKLLSDQKSVTVYGAAYRDNGVMVMPGALSTSTGDDVYVTWSPNGKLLHARFFALLIPSGGASTAIEVVSEGFDAMAFTTHHSYLNSTVVKDDVSYFTRMHFDPIKKAITYTTATSNYDTQGGAVIQTKTIAYNTASKYDTALWESYKNNSLGFGFGVFDNYAGTSASVTLSEVAYSGGSSSVLPSFSQTVEKQGGYYTTFATLAKATYHLAGDEIKGYDKNIAKPYSDVAWKTVGTQFKVLSASDLGMADSGTSIRGALGDIKVNWQMHSDGIYTGNNAAAFAARASDALVISFRGTNDNDGQTLAGSILGSTKDSSDWMSMLEHYQELAVFIEAVDKYVTTNKIAKVYVTGHSLGGAMVQAYMKYHPNGAVNYEAVTFASAAYDFVADEAAVNADRIVSIEIAGDPVPTTGDQYGHVIRTNVSGLKHLEGGKQGVAYERADFHSMDLYKVVAATLDKQLPDTAASSNTRLHGFEKSSFNSSLQTEIYLGASEIPRAWNDSSYETYEWNAPSAFAPKYQTLTGNDLIDVSFVVSPADPIVFGGGGIDTVRFLGSKGGFSWNFSTLSNEAVLHCYNEFGFYDYRLKDVERLHFSDKRIAFDITADGNAGKALMFIGALAYPLLKSPETVGGVLSLFDQGVGLQQLAQAAISAGIVRGFAGSSSNLDLAKLAYRNVIGSEAPDAVATSLASLMIGNGGSMSQADFIATVAQLDVNQQHVNLVGLQTTGVEYW